MARSRSQNRRLRMLAPLAVVVLAGCPITGDPDLNGDDVVDLADVGVVLGCLTQDATGACAASDLDGDGSVTIRDLGSVFERLFSVRAPALVASTPEDGATGVPVSAWLKLDFAAPLASPERSAVTLRCNGRQRFASLDLLDGGQTVVVNPRPRLPAESACTLSWFGTSGTETVDFETAAYEGGVAKVVYDRDDASILGPIPDDYYLEDDPSTETGHRVKVQLPDRPADLRSLLGNILREVGVVDGWSTLAPLVIELSEPPLPESLPTTVEASLDPLASIGLFDLTPGGEREGQRIPFDLKIRNDTIPGQPERTSLVIFPSIPLPPGGQVGLVLTRRMLAASERPFGPSDAFARSLTLPEPGESATTARIRGLAGDVLQAVADTTALPIPPEDVALAVRISVRTTESITHDLLVMKDEAKALGPQPYVIDKIEPNPFANAAAVVEGRWLAPDWRIGQKLARDDNGDPVIAGNIEVPFVLALPDAALDGPVPITMYQHGNPGSSQEVRGQSARFSAADGFAVIGFTDPLNLEVGQDGTLQTLAIFANLLLGAGISDFWVQTYGEQMAFLEFILSLGNFDLLPLGAPDGVPDLDVSAPLTYVGISQGANHGQAFMAYAPEIRAGALVTGGTRLAEILFHQDGTMGFSFLTTVPQYVPSVTAPEIWEGLSLFQLAFDRQDPQNHAEFIYRHPIEVAGTKKKPSLFVAEGLDDPLVTNNSTRSLAWLLGPIPHLEPVRAPVPFLTPTPGPVVANIDSDTSAAYAQYRPLNASDGLPPDDACAAQPNGHYCGQIGSRPAQSAFFRSAVNDPVPVIASQRAE